MLSVWLFFISNLIYFLPLSVSLFVAIDFKDKKLHFCLKIFGITVIGGYCTANAAQISVHLSERFAILLPYVELIKNSAGKKFDFTAISFFSFKSCLLLSEKELSKAGLFSFFIYALNSPLARFFKKKAGYLNIKHDLAFSEKNYGEAFFLKITAATSLFSLNQYISLKLLEGVIKKCKTKKTT